MEAGATDRSQWRPWRFRFCSLEGIHQEAVQRTHAELGVEVLCFLEGASCDPEVLGVDQPKLAPSVVRIDMWDDALDCRGESLVGGLVIAGPCLGRRAVEAHDFDLDWLNLSSGDLNRKMRQVVVELEYVEALTPNDFQRCAKLVQIGLEKLREVHVEVTVGECSGLALFERLSSELVEQPLRILGRDEYMRVHGGLLTLCLEEVEVGARRGRNGELSIRKSVFAH